MKEAPGSSETSVLTRATRRNNIEDTILHSHRRENLKSYNIFVISRKAIPVSGEPLHSTVIHTQGHSKQNKTRAETVRRKALKGSHILSSVEVHDISALVLQLCTGSCALSPRIQLPAVWSNALSLLHDCCTQFSSLNGEVTRSSKTSVN
jgi:hypothetical protein